MIMTHEEMIAVIQADKDGKAIEMDALHHEGVTENGWCDYTGSGFDFKELRYRIKPTPPKPREWWVNKYAGYFTFHDSEVKAKDSKNCECKRTIHVREVLPEEDGK